MGSKRLKWVQLLNELKANSKLSTIEKIENFRREQGLPIPMWGFPASLKDENIISWNSSCPHHNLEMNEVFHAEKMIKSFNELEEHNLKDKNINQTLKVMPKKIWLETKEGEIIEFRLPRGFLPTHLIDEQLYLTMEDKGVYYGLLVDRDGDFKVSPIQSSRVEGKEVPCSSALKKHYKNWPLSKRLYQDSYCKAIWDTKQKTYQVFMVGWSCP